MSMEDLLKNGKSTTFFVTMTVLILGTFYLFFGPGAESAEAATNVADFMKDVSITYIIKEAATKGLVAGSDAVKSFKAK